MTHPNRQSTLLLLGILSFSGSFFLFFPNSYRLFLIFIHRHIFLWFTFDGFIFLTCSPSSSSFCPILGKNAFAGLCLNAKIARAKERECVYFWAVFTSLHFRNGDITFLRYFFFFGFPLRNNRERERPTLVKETCVCTWKG
jgi:hypothetical protein